MHSIVSSVDGDGRFSLQLPGWGSLVHWILDLFNIGLFDPFLTGLVDYWLTTPSCTPWILCNNED